MASLQTFRQLLDRNEHLHGAEVALVCDGVELTYAAYARRARMLADAFYRLGLRSQDRVSILAMNCPEFIDVYGVGEAAGFIVAPVNYRLAAQEMAFVIRDSSPRILVFQERYSDLVDGIRPDLATVEHYVCIGANVPAWALAYDQVIASGDAAGPPIQPSARDVLTLLHTSGTTGRPKGAMATHEGSMWTAEWQAIVNRCDLGTKFLIAMPMFHTGGRVMQSAQFSRGGTVVLHRQFNAGDILDAVARQRINMLHMAPQMLQTVMDLPEFETSDVSSLISVQYAAAPISSTLLARVVAKFGSVAITSFGQTEGSGAVLDRHYHTLALSGDPKAVRRLRSIGQAAPCSEVRVVNDEDVEVPIGEVGEICFRSPMTMLGYWNNQAATIETLRGGWLHTGDMGYLDDEGFLYLADRKKDMIISGGENVYSREVEEALISHGTLSEVAVIGIPDARWGEVPKAFVIRKAGAAVTEAELIEHARKAIAHYKCPKRIEFVDDLPRIPSGKVSKVQLRERESTRL